MGHSTMCYKKTALTQYATGMALEWTPGALVWCKAETCCMYCCLLMCPVQHLLNIVPENRSRCSYSSYPCHVWWRRMILYRRLISSFPIRHLFLKSSRMERRSFTNVSIELKNKISEVIAQERAQERAQEKRPYKRALLESLRVTLIEHLKDIPWTSRSHAL